MGKVDKHDHFSPYFDKDEDNNLDDDNSYKDNEDDSGDSILDKFDDKEDSLADDYGDSDDSPLDNDEANNNESFSDKDHGFSDKTEGLTDGHSDDNSKGEKLPNTASKQPLFLLIGGVITVVGGILIFLRKKKFIAQE